MFLDVDLLCDFGFVVYSPYIYSERLKILKLALCGILLTSTTPIPYCLIEEVSSPPLNPTNDMCHLSEQELTALYSQKVEETLLAFEKIELDPTDIQLITIAHDVANLAVKEAINGCEGKDDRKCS